MTSQSKPNFSKPELLPDAELLTALVSPESANELLGKFGCLREVLEAYPQELEQIAGVGKVKAYQFQALREIAKRYCKHAEQLPKVIRSPKDMFDVLADMQHLSVEYFKVIFLNTKNYVIAEETISKGTLNAAVVGVREVFNKAIRRMSASIILAHNHPSGDPSPSQEDIELTKKLMEAGNLLGIPVIDHLIIGSGRYISLKEKGIL